MRLKYSFVFITVFIVTFAHQSVGSTKHIPQLSVQLHSVKHDLTQDFEGTLRSIAEMGVQGSNLLVDMAPIKMIQKDSNNFYLPLDCVPVEHTLVSSCCVARKV